MKEEMSITDRIIKEEESIGYKLNTDQIREICKIHDCSHERMKVKQIWNDLYEPVCLECWFHGWPGDKIHG